MGKILSWFCNIFLKWLVKIIWIKEIKGWENIPKENFILASNHQSHWDQVINAYLCVPRPFTYLGQVDKYTGLAGFLRNIMYKFGDVIPIHRYNSQSKQKALKECVRRLNKGEILIMYPEGTRTRDGKIQEGKKGIGMIYLQTGKPILPVAIKGNFEILPTGKIFPKLKKIVKINIGKPLEFPQEMARAKDLTKESLEYQEICQEVANKTLEEIKKLFEQI